MKTKISNYAKSHDISYMTAWRMVQNNQIPHERLPSGTILIIEKDEKTIIEKENKIVLYARVSSSENKSNLDSQMERLRLYTSAKGYIITKEVKEIGSGLNDNRKGILSLLEDTSWNIIIVEHKDRLARFGTNFLIKLLNQTGRRVEIINEVKANAKEDLIQDFVSIVTSFTARLYGLRRSKRATEKIIKELTEDEK